MMKMKENKYINVNCEQLKIAFIAPSGYGKTTGAEILHRIYGSKNLKLAKPLYDIQNYFYKILNVNVGDRQDGELLQFLGNKIQRDHPYFLADNFYERLKEISNECTMSIITNDDCRPHNYPFLKQMGFIFVGISGIIRNRDDITIANREDSVEWSNEILCDYFVENKGSLLNYEYNLRGLVKRIVTKKYK